MTLETRVSNLIEALLWAQISNVDPEDRATIMNRWRFLIAETIQEAIDDAPRQ